MNLDFLADPRRACLGADQRLFFPPAGNAGRNAVRHAKVICKTCPFTDDCLAYAVKVGDRHGVYGGTTANERALKRGGRRPKATPTRDAVAARRARVLSMAAAGTPPSVIAEALGVSRDVVFADKVRAGKGGARSDPDLYARIDELEAAGVGPSSIARQLHVGRRTVYNRRAQRLEQVAA